MLTLGFIAKVSAATQPSSVEFLEGKKGMRFEWGHQDGSLVIYIRFLKEGGVAVIEKVGEDEFREISHKGIVKAAREYCETHYLEEMQAIQRRE